MSWLMGQLQTAQEEAARERDSKEQLRKEWLAAAEQNADLKRRLRRLQRGDAAALAPPSD